MECLVLMAMLYLRSRTGPEKNGFHRKFQSGHVRKRAVADVRFDSYYIAGVSDQSIYLGNSEAPMSLMTLSQDLKKSLQSRFPVANDSRVNWSVVRVQLDSPYVFLTDRRTPFLISKNLDNGETKKWPMTGIHFDLSLVLSPNRMVISYHNSVQKVFRMIILNKEFKQSNIYEPTYQLDGNFALDGFFMTEKCTGAIFYVFYYTNQLICLDTNMNLSYSAKLIDTNSIAKIATSELYHDKSKSTEIIMSKPPLLVNKRGYVSDDWVYIHSALASDEEHQDSLKVYAVIDVYRAKDGKYLHSFKIPNHQNQKLRDFAVYKKKLFVLFDHYLVSYEMK